MIFRLIILQHMVYGCKSILYNIEKLLEICSDRLRPIPHKKYDKTLAC